MSWGGDSWFVGGLISCDGAEAARPVVPPGTGTTKNQSDADGQGGTNWPIRARSAANWATKWAGFVAVGTAVQTIHVAGYCMIVEGAVHD